MKRTLSSKDGPGGKRQHIAEETEEDLTAAQPSGRETTPTAGQLGAPSRSEPFVPGIGTTAADVLPVISQAFHNRSLNNYDQFLVSVEVDKLCLPINSLRAKNARPEIVEEFTNTFKRRAYGSDGNYISVTLDPEGTVSKEDIVADVSRHQMSEENQFNLTSAPNIRVLVIDGVQRLHALRSPAVSPIYPCVTAALFLRKDDLPLQAGDIHTVGAAINLLGLDGDETTSFDKINACLSTLASTMQLPETELKPSCFTTDELKLMKNLKEDISIQNLRKLALYRGVQAGRLESTQKSYIRAAIALYKFPGALKVLQRTMTPEKGRKALSLSHIAFPDLWAQGSETKLVFTLDALAHFQNNLRFTQAEVPSALQRIQSLWDSVLEEFKKRGVPEGEGFSLLIRHPRVENFTESVISRMAEWMRFMKLTELLNDSAWIGKLNLFQSALRVRTLWGTYDVLPQPDPRQTSLHHMQVRTSEMPSLSGGERSSSYFGAPSLPRSFSAAHGTMQAEDEDGPLPEHSEGHVASKAQAQTPAIERSITQFGAPSIPRSTSAAPSSHPQSDPAPPHGIPQPDPVATEYLQEDEEDVPLPALDANLSSMLSPESPLQTRKTSNTESVLKPRRSTRRKRRPARYVQKSSSSSLRPEEDSTNDVPQEMRLKDSDGFEIIRRWKGGFVYQRPKPRSSGFTNIMPESDTESGGLAGNVEGYPHRSRLYFDQYETVVKVQSPWKLSALPPLQAPIWRLKYRMPLDQYELYDKSPSTVEAFLRSLGFRPPHQSFWRLSAEDLSEIRWSVFHFMTRKLKFTTFTDTWQSMGEETFRGLRGVLDAEGYIVIPEFVRRQAVTAPYGAWAGMFKDIEGLYKFFHNDVPDESSYKKDKLLTWNRIRNKDKVPDETVPISNTRWTSTPLATNNRLECKENGRLLRARCVVEVSLWMLAHFLHLEVERFDDIPPDLSKEGEIPAFPPMYATDSGSHVLVTSEKCINQVGHTDFMRDHNLHKGKYPEVVGCPGYFVISTGPEGGKLWILKNSHRYLFLEQQAIDHLSQAVGLTQVDIPPWSTILARGDFVHAGMGQNEDNAPKCVRLHDYFLREGVPFADTIDDKTMWRIL